MGFLTDFRQFRREERKSELIQKLSITKNGITGLFNEIMHELAITKGNGMLEELKNTRAATDGLMDSFYKVAFDKKTYELPSTHPGFEGTNKEFLKKFDELCNEVVTKVHRSYVDSNHANDVIKEAGTELMGNIKLFSKSFKNSDYYESNIADNNIIARK